MGKLENTDIERLQATRRRAVFVYRLCGGVQTLFRTPAKIPLFVAAFVVVLLVWQLVPTAISGFAPLDALFSSVKPLLTVALLAVLLFGLLYLFGIPQHARRDEDALRNIGLVSEDREPPALIYRMPSEHSGAERLTWYSNGIPLELWEKRKSDIEHALDIHITSDISYGGKLTSRRHLIVFEAADGAQASRAETLFDKPSDAFVLGYDLDAWNDYGEREPITLDLSSAANSHVLLVGLSGSGKSYAEHQMIDKFAHCLPDGEIYFGDYKGDDAFKHLRGRDRYYFFRECLDAIDLVHSKMMARQAGTDKTRHSITLVLDEYMALILNTQTEDKKRAADILNKVSEILMLGRSLGVRLVTVCQRADAVAFNAGARLNYGVVCVLGAANANRSTYQMLLPEFTDEIEGRKFGRGEGVVLLQGSELRFIKIGTTSDESRMRNRCMSALSS